MALSFSGTCCLCDPALSGGALRVVIIAPLYLLCRWSHARICIWVLPCQCRRFRSRRLSRRARNLSMFACCPCCVLPFLCKLVHRHLELISFNFLPKIGAGEWRSECPFLSSTKLWIEAVTCFFVAIWVTQVEDLLKAPTARQSGPWHLHHTPIPAENQFTAYLNWCSS